MVVLAAGFNSVTVKPSLGSTTVSPATLTVIVLLVSPAAKLTVPKARPHREVRPRRGIGTAARHRPAARCVATLVLPSRVTVKVNGVLPMTFRLVRTQCRNRQARLARVIVADRATGGGRADGRAGGRVRQRHREALVRLHDRVASDVDGDGLAGLSRRKVYRARRQDRPAKSDPAAGFAPLPVTAQPALLATLVLPSRVTVKVNGVLPD